MAGAGKIAARAGIVLAWIVGGLALLLALAVGIVLILAQGPFGRDMIVRLVDGREAGGFTISLSGLEGNPLDRLTAERLEVADSQGVFLTADDILIDWTPRALLGRTLDVDELRARRIAVLRRPETEEREPREDSGGGLPVDIRVGVVDLTEIDLSEGVIGEPARLSVAGRVGAADEVWRARLDVERLDAPGDRVMIDAEAGERFSLTAEMDAAPGGPIAALMQAPDSEIEARAQADGTVQTGEGRLDLTIDGRSALGADLSWADSALRAAGEADSAAWAAFEAVGEILGGRADFDLSVPYGEAGLTALDLERAEGAVRAPNLDVSAQRVGAMSADVHVREAANLVAYFAGDALALRSLSADGRLAYGDGGVGFNGSVAANGLDAGPARFEAVTGPVTVSGPADSPEIVAELVTSGAEYENAQMRALLGAEPALTAWLNWDNTARTLEIAEAELTGADGGRVEAMGVVDVANGRYDMDINAERLPLGGLTDQVAGRAFATGELAGGFDGAVEFAGTAAGRELTGPAAERLGPEVEIEFIGGRRADGRIDLSQLFVESETLLVEATGESRGEDWAVAGDMAWSGGAPVSAVVLEGAATVAFEARSSAGVLDVRAEAAADTVGGGPVLIDGARLRLDGAGPIDAFEADWLLTGRTEGGPVDIGGRAARRGEAVALTGVDGRYGGLGLSGDLLAGPDRIEAEFAAEPETGFGAADVNLVLADGRLDARVEAENLVFGDLQTLDSLLITASGPMERIEYEAAAEGAYGAGFRVRSTGRVETGEQGGSVIAGLDSRYGPVRIEDSRPIEIAFSGEGGTRTVGALSFNDGSLSWDVALPETGPRIRAEFEDVPAALISAYRGTEPLSGDFSGQADLARADGVWRGAAEIDADRISPAEFAEDEDTIVYLNAQLNALLDDQGLSAELTAQGADLDATADLRLASGPVTDFGRLTASGTPLNGSAEIRGEVRGLAAFQLSEAQRLSGTADVTADMSGTVGSPDLDGLARLTGGQFRDDSLGLALDAIELAARFAQDGLEIETLTAQGPDGGSLTGSGRIGFGGGGLSGGADIEFDDLVLADRRDLMAEGDGTVALRFEDWLAVSGETRLSRVEVLPLEIEGGGGRSEPIPSISVEQVNVPPARAQQEQSQSSGPPVRLDYRVVAPARIFIRADQFDTEWEADVTIRGTADDPDIQGTAELRRGRADLLGRAFDFDRGRIRLDGDPMDASLDIVAVRQAREITAQVEVSGTPRSPQISLTSDPSLPEDEVAARLLFDQGASQLTGLQAAQLAAAVASLSGGGGFDPFTALRSATGLDQLAVGSDSSGQTVVTGGRYLTDNVYLEVESGGAAASTTRIEWELRRNLSLLSRLTAGGEAAVAVTWRREYD